MVGSTVGKLRNGTRGDVSPTNTKRGGGTQLRCVIVSILGLAMVLMGRLVWHNEFGILRATGFKDRPRTIRGGRSKGYRWDALADIPSPIAAKNASVVAFAVSFTSLELPEASSLLDAAEVLIGSIRGACAVSTFRCKTVAFVLPSVGMQERRQIREMGWEIIERNIPVALEDIEDQSYREHVVKSGCCGANEFLKLHAYTLTEYHRVVHLDIDTLVLHPMDNLMNMDASLMYTTDPAMAMRGQDSLPVQGGFLLVRPDLEVYEKLRAIIRKGDWKKGKGWGGSNIGWFYGGATIQGLLPYFYVTFAPGTAVEVDRCVYNHMSDSDVCTSDRYAVVSSPRSRPSGENASMAEAIRSVHFTQACTKPWFCQPLTDHEKEGPCRLLQQAWLDGRRTILADRGLPSTEACRKGVYSPIPRR